MESAKASIIAGVALMTAGVLLLLDMLGVLNSSALVWPLIFAAAGAAFLTLFVRGRENWWAAIPGSVFLGLAAVILISQYWPGPAADRAGAFLFLFMGAGFIAVYLRERSNWWAIIPGGVMLTLAVVVALPPEMQGMAVAAVLFLGLAATFAGLSLVPVHAAPHEDRYAGPPSGGSPTAGTPADIPQPPVPATSTPGPLAQTPPATAALRMRWPLIPAGILAVLGVIFAFQATVLLAAAEFVVPALLLLAGVALLVYAYRNRGSSHRGVHGI